MNRRLTIAARLLAAALPVVAATALWTGGASAQPATANSPEVTAGTLAVKPFKAAYQTGITTGTYEIIPPFLGMMVELRLSGELRNTGTSGCYTAQLGVRSAGVWAYDILAKNCTGTPVSYRTTRTAIVTQSPAFGIRVCNATGICGPVTQLTSGVGVAG